MNNSPATVALKMIQYFGHDVRRINHALKVYGFTKHIATLEKLPPEQLTLLEIAALLHDIGIKEAEKQYQSTAGTYQELLGPDIARELLADLNLSETETERVCYLIGHHHSYHKIDALDFQILVEADFLVNIFEDQMQPAQIENIQSKYFKTATASNLLIGMYR
jgi:HD superfamily phosphodiesterase